MEQRSKVLAPAVILIISFAALLAACDEHSDEPWLATTTLTEIQLVDTHATANMGFPLVFDGQGEPHLAYLRDDHLEVLYAHRAGGEWHVETVVRAGDYWNGLALALDASQDPILTYQRMLDGYSAQLEIACRSSGLWSTDTIDTDGYVGSWTSLQVLPSGQIRVGYTAGYPHYDLRYAERVGGEWIMTTIDSAGSAGYYPALASDESGEPFILYSNTHVGLRFARRSGANWSLETLDPGTYTGSGLALTVDSSSRIHIAYPGNEMFKYAVQTPVGDWRFEIIAAQRRSARSLVLDADETPWFVSWDGTTKIGARHEGRWFMKDLPGVESEHVTMSRTLEGRLGVTFLTTGDSLFFAWVTP